MIGDAGQRRRGVPGNEHVGNVLHVGHVSNVPGSSAVVAGIDRASWGRQGWLGSTNGSPQKLRRGPQSGQRQSPTIQDELVACHPNWGLSGPREPDEPDAKRDGSRGGRMLTA